MDIELALQRQALVEAIGKIPELEAESPQRALRVRRAALVRKLEQFDAEHPEIAAALQP